MPVEAGSTRRQQLVELLSGRAWAFEDLRQALGGSLHRLEEDLRHVDRSLRGSGQTLKVEPATCGECGFVFRNREAKHLRPPSRCPECKSSRIEQPRFSIG
ncbi:MAG: transcriptional regulator [Myxococcales bacterium]